MNRYGDDDTYPSFTRDDYKVDPPKNSLYLNRRGQGKTGLTRRAFTDAEKMTICMLHGKGLTNKEIGEKLKRSDESIRTILRSVEQQAIKMGLDFDWKSDVKKRAVIGLRAGLDCETDPYKRGALSIQTLKGVGEFENDASVNMAVMISQVPESMKSRYISLDMPETEPDKGEPDDTEDQ